MTELKRILHVEDDPSIQAVARVALEAVGGFQVLSCNCGQDALDQVQGFADPALPALHQVGADQGVGDILAQMLQGEGHDRAAVAKPVLARYGFAARARVLAAEAARLLALTGCRLGEGMTLKWVHVDLANRVLRRGRREVFPAGDHRAVAQRAGCGPHRLAPQSET